jgi:hypothetical protein
LWSFIPIKFIAVIFIAPVLGFGVSLAFVQINNRPFIYILEAGFVYLTKNKLYIWKKVPKKIIEQKTDEPVLETSSFVPRLSESKLKELSWGLDVYDSTQR